MTIDARVEYIKSGEQKGLWIIIDKENGEGTMHPIEVDEVEPIMKACREYLDSNTTKHNP